MLTGIQQPHISPVDGSFVRCEGSVVAAAGILQRCRFPVSLPGPQAEMARGLVGCAAVRRNTRGGHE